MSETQETNEIDLSPAQMEFLSADQDYTLFCGGLGSGKTHAGALWAIYMAVNYPEVKGLITANSYSQLKKATLSKLFELMDDMGIEFEYKMQEGVILIGPEKSVVYALSMEKYDHLRGIEFGWGWGDECAFYKEVAYQVMIGRIRDTKGPCQWKGTTTPNGFNWLYERFVVKPPKSSRVVYSKTSDNLMNIRASYVDDLKEQYDSKLAQQELDGQFVNLTSGKVYYKFDRHAHCKPVVDNKHYLFVGLDFNVHPLCGVFVNVVDDTIHVFGELYQEDSNTFKASKELLQTFPERLINVICDETGNRRRTSSPNTDHEILRRAGLNVLKFKNPAVKDRDNNVNRLFEQNRIVIDPSCKVLIRNLEQLVYDNQDEMLGHITDALGYVCWHIFPLRKPKRSAEVKYR
jgi:PBSX family phage terminase large subunit